LFCGVPYAARGQHYSDRRRYDASRQVPRMPSYRSLAQPPAALAGVNRAVPYLRRDAPTAEGRRLGWERGGMWLRRKHLCLPFEY